jgi:hypothetical protein
LNPTENRKLNMKPNLIKSALICGLVLSSLLLRAQDHGHLNAGAVGTNQNDQLNWNNAVDFMAASGYVKTFDYTNAGKYAGYYQGNITPTAFPQTPAYGGPVAGAASLGALLQGRISLLAGPVGGKFGFWDTNSTVASGPTISVGVGETSTNLFWITQADGSPGADPFGHIHGRRLSATKPGLYQVGFQAFDVSTNGAGGGPIHTPSAVLPVWFQAGVNIESVEPDYEDGHVHVRFGAPANTTWQLESIDSLSSTNWRPAGASVTGQDYFIEVLHEGDPGLNRFYRVRRTAP